MLVIEGASEKEAKETAFWADLTEREHVSYYTDRGMTKSDAIKQAARDRGGGKSEIYNIVMKKD